MKFKMVMLSAMTLATMSAQAQSFRYPKAPQSDAKDRYFDVEIADPFRPLEDDNSAETQQWVAAENKLTRSYLDKLPQRERLMKRMKTLVNYEKIGTPFHVHGTWYVYKNNGLQNQSVLYKMEHLGGKLIEVLDPNKLSADGTVALKGINFSHNGHYMAYIISRSGSDWQEIYVKDLQTGRDLSDHIEWAKFSGAAWKGDGFYYSAYDAPTKHAFSGKNEVHKVYYHRLGTPQKDDVLFYQNPAHPLRFYHVSVNKEETLMYLIESGEGNGNNLFVRDLRQPDAQFIQMTNDMSCQYSPQENIGDSIYIFTNWGAPKNRLMVADLKNPGVSAWKEVIPEGESVLEDVTFTNGKLILSYNKDACTHAYWCDMQGKNRKEIALPSGTASFYGKRDLAECFYSFSSFTTPGSIYQLDVNSGKASVYAAPKVAFDSKNFETKQVFFTSKDGTRVPMFLTFKKGLKRNGKNPVFLYGYGGFNIPLYPSFSALRIPFLEQGGIYVQVNLRGGSEYGEAWHLAGTKMQKQNVFDDFIAAAEWLIAQQYTDKKHLAIVGGSNGGLLVGACMTQRPDLYAVCIPQVGVLDMLRYHRFTIGWNWAPDYGTSADSKEMFNYLRGYSPLHNIKKGVHYPATLITTADHDDRVVPAHSFKFAATLQQAQGGTAPILIRIDSKAGHGGGKPLSKQIEEQADIYSFILQNMGK